MNHSSFLSFYVLSVFSTLLDFAERVGVADRFKDVLGPNPIPVDVGFDIELDDKNWYLQRPATRYHSNMVWVGPGDEEAHNDFLQVLGKGGFDLVLEGLAHAFELKTLTVVQVTFLAVTSCMGLFYHWEFLDTGGKAFNIIVPLISVDGTDPELAIQDDTNFTRKGGYKYKDGEAIVFGDNAIHGTNMVDYEKGYCMGATVYVADITEDNVEGVMQGKKRGCWM